MPDVELSGEFVSKHFHGWWRKTGSVSSGEGNDERPFEEMKLVINAKCNECFGTASTSRAQHGVQMRCPSCHQDEFVKRELLDLRAE